MLTNGTVFPLWGYIPCFPWFTLQTSAPAGLSSSLQPWWLNQPSPGTSLGHPEPSEQVVPGLCSLCCQSHPQPAGSVLQGAAQTHPSTAGTLPVLCRDLGSSWAQSLWQKRSRSLCIVWLSGDSVSPGEMPYRAPAAPIPARWRRDSHSLPVQDLFGLGLVQILAGC